MSLLRTIHNAIRYGAHRMPLQPYAPSRVNPHSTWLMPQRTLARASRELKEPPPAIIEVLPKHLEKEAQDRYPIDIKVRGGGKTMTVTFDNGCSPTFSAELLRVESPSAQVQGHSPSQRRLVSRRSHVRIINVEEVGRYAIKLTFDDLHNTGIYSWSFLYGLGINKYPIMKSYIKRLRHRGLSRRAR